MWAFNYVLGVAGHVSHVVIHYRSKSRGNRPTDGKMVVDAKWSFVTGDTLNMEYCTESVIISTYLRFVNGTWGFTSEFC